MIRSFKNDGTEDIFNGKNTKRRGKFVHPTCGKSLLANWINSIPLIL